jgi:hypothetical protein
VLPSLALGQLLTKIVLTDPWAVVLCALHQSQCILVNCKCLYCLSWARPSMLTTEHTTSMILFFLKLLFKCTKSFVCRDCFDLCSVFLLSSKMCKRMSGANGWLFFSKLLAVYYVVCHLRH